MPNHSVEDVLVTFRAAQSPPVVYLETQDYSRFGDVLRGKSDSATEALFLALEQRKQTGNAVFAISMPVFSELLQYDSDFRDTRSPCSLLVMRRSGDIWACVRGRYNHSRVSRLY